MEKKHAAERDLLMKLIQDASTSEFKDKANGYTPEERTTKLFELKVNVFSFNYRKILNISFPK